MIAILCALALGIPPGYRLRGRPALHAAVGRVTLWTVHVLLFLLGAALAADALLFAQLPALGLRGLVIGLACSLGSAFCSRYTARALFPASASGSAGTRSPAPCGHAARDGTGGFRAAFKSSAVILLWFALGLAFGRGGSLLGLSGTGFFALFSGGALTEPVILLLLFSVGMSLGFDLSSFAVLRDLRGKVLLAPLAVVAGTFLGAGLAFLLLPGLAAHEILSVGAGFGYYSLAGALLTQLDSPTLGSIALMANIVRELFSLMAAPLLARFFGPLGPLASAGATAMDTCLPMVVRHSGERCGIIAVFSGMTLTLAVPLLVPALLALPRFFP